MKRSVSGPHAKRIALDAPGISDTLRDAAPRSAACVYGGIALRHHHSMTLSWQKFKEAQLDLLKSGAGSDEPRRTEHLGADLPPRPQVPALTSSSAPEDKPTTGLALQVAVSLLYEDAANPRTEFADCHIDELAADIRDRGILQPIVVHPVDSAGRYMIHFGTMRLRAALKAGLDVVPIVVRDAATDPYAAVAENQKRHGLSPLELARFIKNRVVAGESNALIARKLGMDQTTVAHHLALLDLPPPVDQALKAGLCTSPRTLYELSKLHDKEPEQVSALIAGGDVTRRAVAALKAPQSIAPTTLSPRPNELAKATATCALLERSVDKINRAREDFREADLTVFRQRLSELAHRLG